MFLKHSISSKLRHCHSSNPAEQQVGSYSVPDTSHLIHEPRACFIGVTWCCKFPQCGTCRCTSSFFSTVWSRVRKAASSRLGEAACVFRVNTIPGGSPVLTHGTHGTLHSCYRGRTSILWPGFAPSTGGITPRVRYALETTMNTSAPVGTLLRDRSREMVCPGLFALRCCWRYAGYSITLLLPPVSPPALQLIPLLFALHTEIWPLLKFHLPCW